jgi:hypothetical protein
MARVDGLIRLDPQLALDRCPHCGVDCPSLKGVWETETTAYNGAYKRYWIVYECSRCGGLITAFSEHSTGYVKEIFPGAGVLEDSIPDRARSYLQQAIDSLHSPAGAVMLAASSVDAMLKAKNYKDGSLYSRIEKAADDHLITSEMAKWAHQVRLDANDPRHADEAAPLPETTDAERSIHFAQALGMFLFTLPAKVTRGIKESAPKPPKAKT